MLFQQNMRLPIDAECLSSQKEKGEEVILDEVIDALIKSREKVFKVAEVCIKRAQKKQKETYDRKHQPSGIAIGAQVLLENTAQKQRKGGKLEPAWLVPYTVNRCVGKGLYELWRDVEWSVMVKGRGELLLKRWGYRTDCCWCTSRVPNASNAAGAESTL